MMDGSDLSNFVYGFDRNSSSTSVFGSQLRVSLLPPKKDIITPKLYRMALWIDNRQIEEKCQNFE